MSKAPCFTSNHCGGWVVLLVHFNWNTVCMTHPLRASNHWSLLFEHLNATLCFTQILIHYKLEHLTLSFPKLKRIRHVSEFELSRDVLTEVLVNEKMFLRIQKNDNNWSSVTFETFRVLTMSQRECRMIPRIWRGFTGNFLCRELICVEKFIQTKLPSQNAKLCIKGHNGCKNIQHGKDTYVCEDILNCSRIQHRV